MSGHRKVALEAQFVHGGPELGQVSDTVLELYDVTIAAHDFARMCLRCARNWTGRRTTSRAPFSRSQRVQPNLSHRPRLLRCSCSLPHV